MVESSKSSESPKKNVALVEVEDSLGLSESINETAAEKEDSIEYFVKNLPDPMPPEQVSPVAPVAPVPPTTEEIPASATMSSATNPTLTEAPATEATPLAASQNAAIKLFVGLSATVNNLHTFIAEDSQRVIDHVNAEMHMLHDRLNQLDSNIQKLQSILSLPTLAVAPFFIVAPSKTSSPSSV